MNRVECRYADMNGYCDSSACHNMNVVGNIIPKERPENISNCSIWVKPQSNWHTGTPTEEGLYAVYYLNDNNPTGEEYETLCDVFVSPVFNDGCVERWDNYNRCLVFDADEIVRWQKIEPFKED